MTRVALPQSKTVVVADATDFVRDRFRAALEQAGHSAVTPATASELLDALKSLAPPADLALLDLRLPGQSGLSLVRKLRRRHEQLPLVIFSGTVASADEVRELSALGISAYVNEYSSSQHIVQTLAPHLFPDRFNRRDSPRVVLGIPISCRLGSTIAAAVTLNVSRGGLAVRSTNPLEVGSKVRLRFRLPGAKQEIGAEARVAWADRRIGMGLQFEQVGAADQVALDAFVSAHFFSNRKA